MFVVRGFSIQAVRGKRDAQDSTPLMESRAQGSVQISASVYLVVFIYPGGVKKGKVLSRTSYST